MTIKFDKSGYAITSGFITVYNVTPDKGEYIGSSTEFISAGQGLPAFAYIDKPLEDKKGFAICRVLDSESWEYIVDYRGRTRYSTLTKEQILIKDLGDYPASTTDIVPTQFDQWDGNMWVSDEVAKSAAMVQAATLKKTERKATADSEIAWRQDAIDGGYAETNEVIELATWKKYRVLLMRIDTSNISEIEWPKIPS
ncbi:TPA: tail fiber assembly protein [Yersinia enterocolitica]|nr:tail fiber assembly protein [Yersinia enterocolitica]HDL8489496.1 tail fiber assembly protein [Yersinia enterocolitica]